jgi:hypothetical protein
MHSKFVDRRFVKEFNGNVTQEDSSPVTGGIYRPTTMATDDFRRSVMPISARETPQTLLGLLPRELREFLLLFLPYQHLLVEAQLTDMAPVVSAERREKSRDLLCGYAAEIGSLSLLQWAREKGCCWNEWVCESAAYGGHLAVLEWARQNGCPWDKDTCMKACANGHLVVLQWARAHGCRWDWSHCLTAAKYGGHKPVVKWLKTQEDDESDDSETDSDSYSGE